LLTVKNSFRNKFAVIYYYLWALRTKRLHKVVMSTAEKAGRLAFLVTKL
jgi:hypothetical protein